MKLAFELGDTVLYQLAILDKVLIDIRLQPVFENTDFIIHDSSSTFGLDLSVVRLGRNTVPIDFMLEGGGMRIDVDSIQETFEWSNESMKNTDEVSSFIKQLLTCTVLMEYCGSHTSICLFQNDGKPVFKSILRYYSFFGSFFYKDCEKKLFLPIYPQT